MQNLVLPLGRQTIKKLRVGQRVSLSGVVYTARDQAHKRLARAMEQGNALPFAIKGAAVYYCGPAPARPGSVIGACGPTTSARMDKWTPGLLKAGLSAMIGKGGRSGDVARAIRKYNAVYFLAYGGCGALLSTFVRRAEVFAYPKLGPEAIWRLEFKDFPLVVGIV
ncbi:MAG: FumA C-terminus/TtdB family hydratase beta subunit [Candidatus Omnitrophota bacterium]